MSLVQQGSVSTYLVLTSSCDGASQSLDDEVSVWYLLAHIFTWYLLKVTAGSCISPECGKVNSGARCQANEDLWKELTNVNNFCSLL